MKWNPEDWILFLQRKISGGWRDVGVRLETDLRVLGEVCFDLPDLILQLRPDLCRRFGFHLPRYRLAFFRWLYLTGVHEYPSLGDATKPQDLFPKYRKWWRRIFPPACPPGLTALQALLYLREPQLQRWFPLPVHLRDFQNWFYAGGAAAHGLGDFLTEAERDYGRRISECDPLPARPVHAEFPAGPGVNLIGFARGQLGIGEDLRMAARAFFSAGVAVDVVNFPPGRDIPQNDLSVDALIVEEGRHAVNVFCLTALEHGRFFAERGPSQMAGRYNIGYWPWELGKWPEEWLQMVCLCDEVWVSSSHTWNSLSALSPVPVHLMPMAVEVDECGTRNRASFGLPEETKLFCFSMDLNSSIHRKNPSACLEAFQIAFPADQPGANSVGLVIKTHRPQGNHPVWEDLKSLAASDARILIVEETLPREDLLALYRCCDCFLSLHRAEGFGRGIAEALLLGLHVIATGYSGNTDFCSPPGADLVRYRMVPVAPGQYPFSKGAEWADPDVVHAAECMRKFAAGKQVALEPGERFEARTIGAAYRRRIEKIRESGLLERAGKLPFPRVHRRDGET